MQKSIAVGVSLTKEILAKIDTERGDISRSRYILRIIEKNVSNNVVGGIST
jgi:metal-responsive CopG/Arc/MetJ family transcriptional regulator